MSRKALVTGCSSGIGRATAIALYHGGWDVAICGRRGDALAETEALMRMDAGAPTRQIVSLVVDLQDESQVASMFEKVKEEFGRLDMLFNNAGIGSPKKRLDELSMSDFRNVFETNVMAVILCSQHAIRLMKAQDPPGGRIINNGSLSAHVPRPLSTAYTMSKHAIEGLTKTIALDYRQWNISCSQIDIGNAQSSMSDTKTSGALQANGNMQVEPVIDAKHCGDAVLYMANLPPEVNILTQASCRFSAADLSDHHGNEHAVRRTGLNAYRRAARRCPQVQDNTGGGVH